MGILISSQQQDHEVSSAPGSPRAGGPGPGVRQAEEKDLEEHLQQINPFSPLPTRSATAFNLLRQFTDTEPGQLQSLWRTKRQASTKGSGLLDVDEDDLYEFLQDFQIYKSEMIDNI